MYVNRGVSYDISNNLLIPYENLKRIVCNPLNSLVNYKNKK